MTILYMANIALLPFLGLLLWPFGLSIWSAVWWAPIWWLTILTFVPTSVMNMLAIFFGDGTNKVSRRLDTWTVWLMKWVTSNASIIVWNFGSLILFVLWLFNFSTVSYFFLWFLYMTSGVATQWIQITKGESVIKGFDADWEGGSKSGLLWPWILIWIGLVDDNDEPKYFDIGATSLFSL